VVRWCAQVHSNVAFLPISLRYFHSHSSQHPAQLSPQFGGMELASLGVNLILGHRCSDLLFRRYVASCCTGVKPRLSAQQAQSVLTR
jgi:hypothetical protein